MEEQPPDERSEEWEEPMCQQVRILKMVPAEGEVGYGRDWQHVDENEFMPWEDNFIN